MKLSTLYTPILKEAPSDCQVISHQLMVRAGFIRQSSSGIYSFLPLAYRVLQKITRIIEEEQIRIDSIPFLMPTLQDSRVWKESGRYDSYGKEMLKIKDRHDRELVYSPTNEEFIADLVKEAIVSYRDLPKCLFQIHWKFRDEIRPRFGLMRGREFLMKDAYSFDATKEGAKRIYEKMMVSYFRIFARLGLKVVACEADSGPIGGNLNREFLVLTPNGESQVFLDNRLLSHNDLTLDPKNHESIVADKTSYYAATEDKHNEAAFAKVPEANRLVTRGIEVGHIFYFGNQYSLAMNLYFTNELGQQQTVEMGSYGIGVSRVMAAVIESMNDEKGMIWPMSIAPFSVTILPLSNDPQVVEKANGIYQQLIAKGIDVLIDDRDERAGAKFATADLIGIPVQIAIGAKSLQDNSLDVKLRQDSGWTKLAVSELDAFLNRVQC